jgi:hypothetical protein
MARLDLSPRVEPNERIDEARAFFPAGHRGVLDIRRQLVVGNRGMGKSFWTHALTHDELRTRLAGVYGHVALAKANVRIGFNGSDRQNQFTPTRDEVAEARARAANADQIWRAVLVRIAKAELGEGGPSDLSEVIHHVETDASLYSATLTRLDDKLSTEGRSLLVVFDALERLGRTPDDIHALTGALLRLALGLQSFRSIRAKLFMRVDQYSDQTLFRFPDSSKIRNDHVSLVWHPTELYGLLLFEILRDSLGGEALRALATGLGAEAALPLDGRDSRAQPSVQASLVHAFAGEFMGGSQKRGRVHSWVPLHLSDAANTCSPRSFISAWHNAAEHLPAPSGRAVDHLGLIDGVRLASRGRLHELYEDYAWIQPSLEALRGRFVPMTREQLFEAWNEGNVIPKIRAVAAEGVSKMLASLSDSDELGTLLDAMKHVAVIEERSNGKINVPDIFRVEAGILRKGGVAVPKRLH